MLNPFFQLLYSTVLNEKLNNLLPTFSRCFVSHAYQSITYCFSNVRQSCEFTSASQCYKNEKLLLSTSLY